MFFALIAAIIHVYIFILESMTWTSDKTRKIFRLSASDALILKAMAFNQGFYNLFLALAIFLGVIFQYCSEQKIIGDVLMLYGCTSMLMASLVLISTNKKLYRAALIQGLPPMLFILSFLYNL